MSEAAPPRVQHSERRPLRATIWFTWMVAMWVAFFVFLAADRIDAVWSWVRDLPLVAELVLWVALFPWLLGMSVWMSSWAGWLRLVMVLCFAFGWSLASIPRRKRPKKGGAGYEAHIVRGLGQVAVVPPPDRAAASSPTASAPKSVTRPSAGS
jgi:hypothetical protein